MDRGAGVYPELVRARLERGWPLDRASMEPPIPRARLTRSEVQQAISQGGDTRFVAETLGITPRHAREIRSRRAWKTV